MTTRDNKFGYKPTQSGISAGVHTSEDGLQLDPIEYLNNCFPALHMTEQYMKSPIPLQLNFPLSGLLGVTHFFPAGKERRLIQYPIDTTSKACLGALKDRALNVILTQPIHHKTPYVLFSSSTNQIQSNQLLFHNNLC